MLVQEDSRIHCRGRLAKLASCLLIQIPRFRKEDPDLGARLDATSQPRSRPGSATLGLRSQITEQNCYTFLTGYLNEARFMCYQIYAPS